MSAARTGLLRLLSSAAALPAWLRRTAQAAGSGQSAASPWVELHDARVRLVAGPPAAKAAKSYLAGVEIALARRLEDLLAHAGRRRRAAELRLGRLHQRRERSRCSTPRPRAWPRPAARPSATSSRCSSRSRWCRRTRPSRSRSSSPWSSASAARSAFPAEASFDLDAAPAGTLGQPVAGDRRRRSSGAAPAGASRRAERPASCKRVTVGPARAPRRASRSRRASPRGGQGADRLHRGAGRPLRAAAEAAEAAAARTAAVRFEVDLARGGNRARAQGQDA